MTYLEEIAYFENLASKHKNILHSPTNKHFVRLNVLELVSAIKTNANFPLVAFEKPSYPIVQGAENDVKLNKDGSLMFLMLVSDKGDFDAISIAEQTTIDLAQDFMQKMIFDARDLKFLHLNRDSFRIDIMPAPLHGKIYGCRLNYKFMDNAKDYDNSIWLI